MTQELPRLLTSVLTHPPQIFRVTAVPFSCQMLSGMLRNNHEDKTEPALHDVSLKAH